MSNNIMLFNQILTVTQPVNNNDYETANAHIPPPRPAPPVIQQQPVPSPPQPSLLSDFHDEEDSDEPDNPDVVEKEFDLLNLNTPKEKTKPPPIPEAPKLSKMKEPSFDLLGGFDSNFQDPFPDLVGSAMNKPTEPVVRTMGGNDLDDIFGSLPQTSTPLIPPVVKPSNNFDAFNMTSNTSKTTKPTVIDPFADLASSLNPDFKSSAPKPSPAHQFNQPDPLFSQRNPSSTASNAFKSPTEPKKPDYSRSHFQDKSEPAQNKPKSADIFGDILGSQGYSFGAKGSQGPRSINEMRKVEQAQTMDPEKLKVMEWVSDDYFQDEIFANSTYSYTDRRQNRKHPCAFMLSSHNPMARCKVEQV